MGAESKNRELTTCGAEVDVKGPFRAARGTEISSRVQQEAALRMLMNNLDPEVAEKPQDLIVYGGTGRAARNWECFHAIGAFAAGLAMTKLYWCNRQTRRDFSDA